jgi:SPP1 family predicted phage head-tail adaptor
MRAGDLRHRLTIESPQRLSDGAGGATVTWTQLASVWAHIKPVSARELRSAEQRAEKVTHEIVLRYRTDINSTMRLTGEGRTFNIEAIINEAERDRWLKCFCVEGLTT